MFYIYLIENNFNNKLYVGLSENINRRFSEHCKPCTRWKSIISNSITKYGRENFELIYLEKCDSLDEANKREIYWIKTLNTLSPNGYNLRKGGRAGGSPTEEVRQKMSESRKKITGWKHSEETKRKIALGNKGKVVSEKTRKKISDAAKQRTTNSMQGRKHSEETRHKMAEKAKLRNRQRDAMGHYISG